jgi:Tol biopolymer transport system component
MDHKPVSAPSDTDPVVGSEKKEKTGSSDARSEKKQPSESLVTVRIPKKRLLSGLITLGIIFLGLAAWQFGWYQSARSLYNQTAVTIEVRDSQGMVLNGAMVEINGATYTTDSAGQISVDAIQAGSYTVRGILDGYEPVAKDIQLQRADKPIIALALNKLPDVTYGVRGIIQDIIGSQPIVDAQVTLLARSQRTNPSGEFTFSKLAPGEYTIRITRAGFDDREQVITIKDADLVLPVTSLVPSGKVLFVSNRDGKRAIYTAGFDGGSQKQVVSSPSQLEDYNPVVSPNGQLFTFSSTRDKVVSRSGSAVARLYMANREGTEVIKVNDDVAPQAIKWSPNSKFFTYTAWADTDFTTYVQRIYEVNRKQVITLESGAGATVFSPTQDQLAYVVAKQLYSTPGPGATNPAPIPGAFSQEIVVLNPVTGERKALYQSPDIQFVSALSYTDDGRFMIVSATTLAGSPVRFKLTISDGAKADLSIPISTPAANRTYTVSPDGTEQIFVEKRDGKTDIFLQVIKTGAERRLTQLGSVAEYQRLLWDESGRYIIFTVAKDETALYVMSAAGGTPRKVVDVLYDNQGY